MIVVGARPQIIKSSLLIKELERRGELILVHTGQHYDWNMSTVFFEDLDLKKPDYFLDVGSGSHGEQTARIMSRLEPVIKETNPDIVLVPGDTNSTLAGAITAIKLGVPVGHIEAGLRSFDYKMPEEINRRLTDHSSSILFAPTQIAKMNLVLEGITADKIYITGDTMLDVYLKIFLPKIRKNGYLTHGLFEKLRIEKNNYALMTLHRQENVDDRNKLESIIKAICNTEDIDIIFPAHPRTRKRLVEFGLERLLNNCSHVKVIEPLSYTEFLTLLTYSRFALTDSGGVQKEAFFSGVPCITLRYNTEWIETLELGVNRLVGTDKELIIKTIKDTNSKYSELKKKIRRLKNPYGDGQASQKIVNILNNVEDYTKLIKSSNYIKNGIYYPKVVKVSSHKEKVRVLKDAHVLYYIRDSEVHFVVDKESIPDNCLVFGFFAKKMKNISQY